jgi:D-arabinose 1-dehydrogenase-like Zn-dependent alcohol dehydrogenase
MSPLLDTSGSRFHACGVCHSDALTKDGGWPRIVYPRSSGHEIAGFIDALGEGTDPAKVSDRVGIGWQADTVADANPAGEATSSPACVTLQVPGHQLRRWLLGVHVSADGGLGPYPGSAVRGGKKAKAGSNLRTLSVLICF